MKYIFFFIVVFSFIVSCNKSDKNIIKFANIGYNLIDSTYIINTSNIITNGIIFPYENIQSDGSIIRNIKFKFLVEKEKSERLFYKIYYQNESYKFDESDSLSYENFYGSWSDTTGFKEVLSETVIDSFTIIGNPRFEQKYMGANFDEYFVHEDSIAKVINNIKTIDDWRKSVKEKARNNNMSFKEQAYMDAIWVLKDRRNIGNYNHPWKRNPRMGKYSALLVVCTEKALRQIPEHIKYVHKHSPQGLYTNPYSYFITGEGKKIEGVYTYLNNSFVNLRLVIKPETGVFVDKAKLPVNVSIKEKENCGSSYFLFKNALFEHFFSHENRNFKLNTIPVLIDWEKDNFSLNDYNRYKKAYADVSKRKSSWIRNVECACENINVESNFIEIFNPPSKSLDEAAKLNVGIKTRVGITYGKITAKVKFSKMLNKHNIWNGITNAIWLITQDLHQWNSRRYSSSGYTPKGNPQGERSSFTSYSEIDFELVKASPYWPYQYYKDLKLKKLSKNYDGTKDNLIVVAVTNWDLASKDPENFDFPIQYIKRNNKEYEALRWDELYQALTIRTPVNHDEIFNREYYFFQIEWKPEEIIWRIGPEKNKLYEVGYMSSKNTSIPNNQMVLVINQEYHLAEWWADPVFEQDFIPFLKNKNLGKIFEITIE